MAASWFSQDVWKTKVRVFVDDFRGRPPRTLHVFFINKKATSNLFGSVNIFVYRSDAVLMPAVLILH